MFGKAKALFRAAAKGGVGITNLNGGDWLSQDQMLEIKTTELANLIWRSKTAPAGMEMERPYGEVRVTAGGKSSPL